MPVKSGNGFSSRRSLPNSRSSARCRRRRAALPRRLQPCARSAADRRAGSARCRPAHCPAHCPPHGVGNRADGRSSHCRPGLLRSTGDRAFRGPPGCRGTRDFSRGGRLSRVSRVALPRPAEFPRLVTLAIAVAALARRRPAKIARRVAAVVVAVLHLPRRTLALRVEYVGLRPMAGRDHLVLLRPIPVLVVHILAAERPPQRARGPVLLGKGLCRCDYSQIMLGMLEIVLGHHRIAGGLGIARQLEVFLGDMLGIAADLDVRTVALEHPVYRISLTTAAAARSVLMLIMLTLSHSAIYTRNCDPRPSSGRAAAPVHRVPRNAVPETLMSKKADLRGNLRQSRSSAHGFRKLSALNGFNLRRERRQPELTSPHPPSALPGPAVVPAMSAECPCRDASIGRDTTRLPSAFQLLFSYAECPKFKIHHAPWRLRIMSAAPPPCRGRRDP